MLLSVKIKNTCQLILESGRFIPLISKQHLNSVCGQPCSWRLEDKAKSDILHKFTSVSHSISLSVEKDLELAKVLSQEANIRSKQDAFSTSIKDLILFETYSP